MVGKQSQAKVFSSTRNKDLGCTQMVATRTDKKQGTEVFWEFIQQSFVDKYIPVLLYTNG